MLSEKFYVIVEKKSEPIVAPVPTKYLSDIHTSSVETTEKFTKAIRIPTVEIARSIIKLLEPCDIELKIVEVSITSNYVM